MNKEVLALLLPIGNLLAGPKVTYNLNGAEARQVARLIDQFEGFVNQINDGLLVVSEGEGNEVPDPDAD